MGAKAGTNKAQQAQGAAAGPGRPGPGPGTRAGPRGRSIGR